MKYKSIELVNYAGIYNGMGLNQIKIDFTKCVSNKIIIRGANGSGKSTLMSAINPNPDSNDKFINNAEARKTLVLSDYDTEYVIRYIHPVTNSGRGTTKGYISKMINGEMVELNPNGNISSCRDIIYDEFGFDSGYASLSQLSSEDRGLVDKKPAERKKLVSAITNSLDTFNNIHKSMSKKASVLKGLTNNLANKIDMIGEPTKVKAYIANLESQLNALKQDRSDADQAIAIVKIKIHDLQQTLQDSNYDEIKTELISVNRQVQSAESIINKALVEYGIESVDKLSEFITYIQGQIIIAESNIKALRDQIPSILNERESEYRELQSKQEKLKGLETEYAYSDLKSAMESIRERLDSCENVFSQMRLSNIKMLTKDEFDTGMSALNSLKNMANTVLSAYDHNAISEDINNRTAVLELISSLPSIRSTLDRLREERSSISAKIVIFESKREIASELINRPSKCTIDDCPYISSALNADREYPQEELIKLSNKLLSIESEIVIQEELLSKAEQAQSVRTDIGYIERELSSNIKFILKLPVRPDFRETFLQRVLEYDTFKDIDELYKYADCGNLIEEYKVLVDQYKTYESEYKVYESKNKIIEDIIDSINILQEKTDNLADKINDINQDILNKESELENLKSTKEKLDSVYTKYVEVYIPNKQRQEELNGTKTSLDMGVQQIQVLRQQLSQLTKNKDGIESDINSMTEKIKSLEYSLMRLNEYKTELDKYNKDYALIEKIRYYSSPNTGIQSIFIGIYMNKILSTANELLGMLFGGEFILQPFIVNETEFRIPCIGNGGLMHDDISSMSTAQKAMISTIISFALLNQSSTKYNIICLDEVDGALDTSNRLGYVNLLDNLMSMLRCEQAFIISHNNELNTSMSDIIVLKDNMNEIFNGHIIWKY